jgi:hypothetical protein
VFVQSSEDCTMHIYEPEDLLNILICHHTTVKHDFSGQTTIFGGIYGAGKRFIGQMRVDSFNGQ